MFDEPDDDAGAPRQEDVPRDPAQRAKEKADEFRMHAELAAVFEGPRKFDAALVPLDAQLAREVQRGVAKLEKAKSPDTPVLLDSAAADAAGILGLANERGLSTGDYHVYRRPGEVMIVRWLEGEQVETFYERAQAHFDVGLGDFRQEERATHEWRQDPKVLAYLDALDKLDVRMAERYLRDAIRNHKVTVLSTVTADEMDVLHLTDYLMGVSPADLVGAASAPPSDDPTERDRAWFFKLFSLRGVTPEGVERMCFFTYLQKAEDTFDLE